MRTVKKTWLANCIPHQGRIDYLTALNELQDIYPNTPREIIDEKLSQGTKLGNGKGRLYQVTVIKNKKTGRRRKEMDEKKNSWEDKKTVWIDKNLHTKLKVLASQRGIKMGTFVEGLINKSLEEKGAKKNA